MAIIPFKDAELNCGKSTFNISITPVNDNGATAIVDNDAAAEAVNENAAIGTVVGITAFSDDSDPADTITYSLDDNDGGRFSIEPATGIVRVAGAIDRESDGASRNITVRATSTDTSFTTRIFAIAINDVNEFAVTAISDTNVSAEAVNENVAIGTLVGVTANASDGDATTNVVTYSLDDNDGGRFSIEAATGIVHVAGAIDRESDGANRNITVRATSSDTSFTTRVFAVTINDINEVGVTAISDTDGSGDAVGENAAIGSLVGVTANATDADIGDTVTYSLDNDDGGRFSIEAATGIVRVAGAIDRETDGASRNITVRVTSTDTSFTTRVFAIAINDLNEFAVSNISDANGAVNEVEENTNNGTVVGLTAIATDADSMDSITYSLLDNDGGRFSINTDSGIVTVSGAIDREMDGDSREIIVQALSSDGSLKTLKFVISIIDVDDTIVIDPPITEPKTEPENNDPEDTEPEDIEPGDAEPENNEPVEIPVIIPGDPEDESEIDIIVVLPTKPSSIAPTNNDPNESQNDILQAALPDIIEEVEERIIPEIVLPPDETQWIQVPNKDIELKDLNQVAVINTIKEVKADIESTPSTWQANFGKITVGTGLSLTAGYVSWILRGGALMSAMMTSMSVWQTYDPLYVVMGKRKRDKDKINDEKLSKADYLFDKVGSYEPHHDGMR